MLFKRQRKFSTKLAAEVGIGIGLRPAYAMVHMDGIELAMVLLQQVQ